MAQTSPLSIIRTADHAEKFKYLLLIIYVCTATIVLIGLAFAAHATPYFDFDLAVTRAVQSFHPAWFDLLMRGVGEPGYPPQAYVWIGLGLAILYQSKLKWQAAVMLISSFGIGVVGLIVKFIVNRPRPSPDLVHVLNPALDGGKFSFPAGHVEVDMAVLGFLLFLSITLPHRYAWTRIVEIVGYGGQLALIGLSRIFVGEHWPSDVLGAYLLGSLWLVAMLALYRWGAPRFFVAGATRKKKATRGPGG